MSKHLAAETKMQRSEEGFTKDWVAYVMGNTYVSIMRAGEEEKRLK